MPEKLLYTWDQCWSRTPPEWWGTWINNSDHTVKLSWAAIIDASPPQHEGREVVPAFHVCMFGGWTGYMGVAWHWRANAPHHEEVALKGYAKYDPRVYRRRVVDDVDGMGQPIHRSEEPDDPVWELYRWP